MTLHFLLAFLGLGFFPAHACDAPWDYTLEENIERAQVILFGHVQAVAVIGKSDNVTKSRVDLLVQECPLGPYSPGQRVGIYYPRYYYPFREGMDCLVILREDDSLAGLPLAPWRAPTQTFQTGGKNRAILARWEMEDPARKYGLGAKIFLNTKRLMDRRYLVPQGAGHYLILNAGECTSAQGAYILPGGYGGDAEDLNLLQLKGGKGADYLWRDASAKSCVPRVKLGQWVQKRIANLNDRADSDSWVGKDLKTVQSFRQALGKAETTYYTADLEGYRSGKWEAIPIPPFYKAFLGAAQWINGKLLRFVVDAHHVEDKAGKSGDPKDPDWWNERIEYYFGKGGEVVYTRSVIENDRYREGGKTVSADPENGPLLDERENFYGPQGKVIFSKRFSFFRDTGRELWPDRLDPNYKHPEGAVPEPLIVLEPSLFVPIAKARNLKLPAGTPRPKGTTSPAKKDEDLENWKQCRMQWGSELKSPNFFVNHFLFFPTKAAAEKAAARVKALGMDFQEFQSPEGEDAKEWGYAASADMVPNLGRIKVDKQKLKKIAEDHGGRYGYWGLEWNGDNP